MKKESKVITFYSPVHQTGQTTLATMIGMTLAKKGKFVLILELSKTTGFSVYLNKNLGEYKRDLKSCLVNPVTFKENIVKSPHSNRLFYVSQNAYSGLTELASYNPANLDIIVEQAKDIFDYVFLDLPSNTDDVATVQILGRNFTHKIDHCVISITENIMGLKRLNDFDALVAKSTLEKDKQSSTLVVNKSYGRYSPFFEQYTKNLPRSGVENIVNIINVNELPYLCNEGNILELGLNAEAKEYFKNISIVANILDEGLVGIGMTKTKDSKMDKKLKGAKINTDEKGKKVKKKSKSSIISEEDSTKGKIKKTKKGKKDKIKKEKPVKEGKNPQR